MQVLFRSCGVRGCVLYTRLDRRYTHHPPSPVDDTASYIHIVTTFNRPLRRVLSCNVDTSCCMPSSLQCHHQYYFFWAGLSLYLDLLGSRASMSQLSFISFGV